MSNWPYITSNWKRLRIAKLNENPVCEACVMRGQTVIATVVDHCIPISQGGAPFPELSGLMSLCARCHGEKTSGYDRVGGNVVNRRFKGCDANGNPIDPADGWFGGGVRDH